jgi:hypothetical protein
MMQLSNRGLFEIAVEQLGDTNFKIYYQYKMRYGSYEIPKKPVIECSNKIREGLDELVHIYIESGADNPKIEEALSSIALEGQRLWATLFGGEGAKPKDSAENFHDFFLEQAENVDELDRPMVVFIRRTIESIPWGLVCSPPTCGKDSSKIDDYKNFWCLKYNTIVKIGRSTCLPIIDHVSKDDRVIVGIFNGQVTNHIVTKYDDKTEYGKSLCKPKFDNMDDFLHYWPRNYSEKCHLLYFLGHATPSHASTGLQHNEILDCGKMLALAAQLRIKKSVVTMFLNGCETVTEWGSGHGNILI